MKDGGGAFPHSHEVREYFKDGSGCSQVRLHQSDGMTLRDYFARQALGGVIIDPGEGQTYGQIAEVCYNLADAMLAEKDKRNGKDI